MPTGVKAFRTLLVAAATGTPAASRRLAGARPSDVPPVSATHQVEVGGRQHDDTEPRLPDDRDDLVLLSRRQGAELGQVADRHPALPAATYGLLRDVAHVQMVRLVEEVGVKVCVDPELAREPEHDVDVRARIAVVVGTAADEIGSRAERSGQQGFRSW